MPFSFATSWQKHALSRALGCQSVNHSFSRVIKVHLWTYRLKGLYTLTVEGSGTVVHFYTDLRGRRRGVGRSQAESVRNARSSRRRRDLCTTTSLSSNLPLHHLRTRLRSRGIARLGVFQTSVLVSRLINYTAILETHYTPCFRKKLDPLLFHHIFALTATNCMIIS